MTLEVLSSDLEVYFTFPKKEFQKRFDVLMIELEEFVDDRSCVTAVEEVVGVWEFSIEGCDRLLKIKVVKTYPYNPEYPYTELANLRIRNPNQASPYRSEKPQSSVQGSIRTALSGFLGFWKPELAEETKLVEVKDW